MYSLEETARILRHWLALKEAMVSGIGSGIALGRGSNVGAYTVPFPGIQRRVFPSRIVFPSSHRKKRKKRKKKKMSEDLHGSRSGRPYSASELGQYPDPFGGRTKYENRPRFAANPAFQRLVAAARRKKESRRRR